MVWKWDRGWGGEGEGVRGEEVERGEEMAGGEEKIEEGEEEDLKWGG